MSEKIDITIDSSIDAEAGSEIVSTSSDNNVDIEVLEPDYNVTINKREYVITGDNMYIPKTYDESPQWLKDIIGTITDFSLNQKLSEIGALSNTLYGLIDELEVAKNTYTNSIITSAEIDERINSRLETLNSSIAESDATIVDMISTKATPTEASSLALNVLTASINDGAISSLVSSLQNAISTTNSTLSNNIDILHSEMTDDFEASADAVSLLQTYIGVSTDGGLTGTGLLSDVEIIQKQNDGVIETTTGTYDVMIGIEDPNNNTDNDQLDTTKEPYATWKSLDVVSGNTENRSSHVGDVYIKYTNAAEGYKTYDKAYKFIKVVPDSTSPYSTDSEGFTWAVITDTDVQNAYVAALNALDLADSKRRVFVTTPTVPYDIGDLWVRVVSGSSQIWRCNFEGATSYSVAHWTLASTDDNAVVLLANGTTPINLTNAFVGTTPLDEYLGSEIDGKIGVYSGITAPVAGQPSGVSINDIYLWMTTASKVLANGTTQTYDVTRTYKYSGSAWVEVTTNNNITALADLADGKRTVFSGNTVPIGAVSRDVWIPSGDVLITNSSMCTVAGGVWTTVCSIPKYVKGEIYQFTADGKWTLATRYSADIEAVRSNLQSQVDGKVETYYSSTVPVGMTIINNGDYWYCTADVSTYKKGKVYKYVHSTTSWIETADVSRYAFDLADGKAAIFTSTSTPTAGYKVNDMLIVVGSFSNGTTTFSDGVVLSSTTTRASGFTASDWIKKINDTEDLDAFVSNVYTPAVSDLQSQVDGQIGYYFYSSALSQTPASNSGSAGWNTEVLKKEHHGDIAYDKSTSTGYYYDRITSTWILINSATNSGLVEALKAASVAQATADGKVSHMYGVYQSTSPATTGAYKYWLTTTKVLKVLEGASWVDFVISKLDTGDIITAWDSLLKDEFKYYWNGSTWYTQQENGIVASSKSITDLNVSLAALGNTVDGYTTLVNTVDASISAEGARVESKFAYGSSLTINGATYNSGFGMTNSAGTGFGSEFWIDASRFKFTNSAKTGSKAPFTIQTDGTTPEITFNGKVNFSNVTNVPLSTTNLIAEDWSISNGSTTMYIMNGETSENVRVLDKNHTNESVVLWTCVPDSSGGASGGWGTTLFPINNNKTYRFTVFVKKNSTSGSVYFGCGDNNTVTKLNTSIKDSNPYFWYGDLPTINEWYLLVGYVYPAGQTGIVSHGGIYKCSNAKKVVDISGFNWASDASTSSHRCYDYYNTDTSSRQWMWNPRVEVIDGEEPSILDLIGKVDVSSDINANNDVFAQKLGYANYNAMVAAAASGQTVINGGYINTSLIDVNAIVANQINTTGLIAENISANEIVGKTLTGSVINGAVVNGSIIKTSYLDLDGDLEILTEYHLCTSQEQLNSLLSSGGYGRLVSYSDKIENGGDAIYMTGSNEYRIPTLSVVSEPIQTFTGQGVKTLIGKIFPYNSTLSNSNLKSRKIMPSISVANTSIIYSSNSLGPNAGLGYGGSYPLVIGSPNFNNGNGTLIEIWLAGVLLIRFGSYYPYDITHRCYIYDAIAGVYVDGGIHLIYSPSHLEKTLTMTTSTFDVRLHYIRNYYQYCNNGEECTYSYNGNIEISILPKTFQLPFNFESGNLEIRSVYTSVLSNFTLQIPSGISINNMI